MIIHFIIDSNSIIVYPHSSVGLERLSNKQKVGGSSPPVENRPGECL